MLKTIQNATGGVTMENFHGYIATPLSEKAKNYGITISADEIETGAFVEIMLLILSKEKKSDDSFSKRCFMYKGKTAVDITYPTAKEIYDEFIYLLNRPLLNNKQVITTCPNCGNIITEENYTGNTFCLECVRNGLG